MAEIKIDYPGVSETSLILRSVLGELERMERELAAIQQALDPEIQSRHDIGTKLRLCRGTAGTIQEQAQRLLRTVEAGCRSYQDLDRRLARMIPSGPST